MGNHFLDIKTYYMSKKSLPILQSNLLDMRTGVALTITWTHSISKKKFKLLL